ncbi:unnamed protein product [Knipowitschia caucasica]
MECVLARNEKLIRENESLQLAMKHFMKSKMGSQHQRTSKHTREETTRPVDSRSWTEPLSSNSSENQFRAGIQPHRASSPVNLKTILESDSDVESKDTGYRSQNSPRGKGQLEKLLGEIAYQLDRRILSHMFPQNIRFYGYTVSQIPTKIFEACTHPLTGKVDEDYKIFLQKRYQSLQEMLRRKGYIITLHPHFSEFIVNRFGILGARPACGSSLATDFENPLYLKSVIESTAHFKLQKDLMILLDCLCEMAEKDAKPVFLW